MRFTPTLAFLPFAAVACSSTPPPRVSPSERQRAAGYAAAAEQEFESGARESAFRSATHALVVRLAGCGFDCPDPAYSFLQLGDLRVRNGQPAWGAQYYQRSRQILLPFRRTHAGWLSAVELRLADLCRRGVRGACQPSE